jgi:hypothetical protein
MNPDFPDQQRSASDERSVTPASPRQTAPGLAGSSVHSGLGGIESSGRSRNLHVESLAAVPSRLGRPRARGKNAGSAERQPSVSLDCGDNPSGTSVRGRRRASGLTGSSVHLGSFLEDSDRRS